MAKASTRADPATLFAAAQRHEAEGRLGAAETAYLQLLAAAPGHPDVLRALALLSHRRGRGTAARRYIERSIAAEPRAETYLILAGLCLAERLYSAAIAACTRAAELAPTDPAPHMEMAGVFHASGDYASAEAALRCALARHPGLPAAHANLGSMLFLQGRFEEAAEAHRSMLAAHPDHALSWKNLGAAERALGNFSVAREAYATAIRHAPEFAEAHCGLGLLDLLLGNAKAGFASNEWRWRSPNIPAPLLQGQRWQGERLDGRTILLHYEQGFGDTLQFLCFVPLVAERGGRVLLRVQRSLEGLAASLHGVTRLVPEGERLPHYDLYAYLLSLPLLLGLDGPPNPPLTPYLAPPPARVAHWRQLLPPTVEKRIGLVWCGNPTHDNDQRRSIAPNLLGPLLGAPGCMFFSLHPTAEPPDGVRRLPARISDFTETAAAILNLDLVIAVDTAVAHLAGALGRPVWILLPAVPDWRWDLTGSETPWYPSARLYRQTVRNDWTSVLARVAAELATGTLAHQAADISAALDPDCSTR